MAARPRTSPRNSASPGNARTGGLIDTARKESPGSTTGRHDPAPARGRPAPGVKPLLSSLACWTGWAAADRGRHRVPARTVSRILARYDLPPLSWLDSVTGRTIRSSRATANRYERDRPGQLLHIDVKKLGRIPDGGGWRADPGQGTRNTARAHAITGSVSTTSTPSSTTTAASPMPRSTTMRRAAPPAASSNAPPRSSPAAASAASNESPARTPSPTGTRWRGPPPTRWTGLPLLIPRRFRGCSPHAGRPSRHVLAWMSRRASADPWGSSCP
jgi:hypothetical protein